MDNSAYHGYGYSQQGHQQPYPYQNTYYPQPGQPGGPYHQTYMSPPPGEPAYYGQQPQGAQMNACPLAAPSGGQHALQAQDAVKGLGKRFKGLMGRSRRSSCSSSSSSSSSSSNSSSSSDSDASKKKKNKKKGKKPTFATKPHSDPRYGPHPFSIFCPPSDAAHITLTLADAGAGPNAVLLLGPRHDASQPAFRIEHHYGGADGDGGGGFRCWRHDLPDLDPSRPVLAGSAARQSDNGGRCAFEFPWGGWDLDVDGLAGGAVDEVWQSDVGLCGGRSWMRWCVLLGTDERGEGDGRFVARCFDVTQRGMPTVASFEVGGHRDGGQDRGRLEIVAGLVRTVEQLDELVVVSYAVMDGIREGLQRRDE